jgi:hypothetical protein
MVSFPRRAQLSNHQVPSSESGDQATRPIPVFPRPGQEGSYRPALSAIPQPSTSLRRPGDSLPCADQGSLHRPSLYSDESSLGGSTLCPTPRSAQLAYNGGYSNDTPFKASEGSTPYDEIVNPATYTVETLHPVDDAGRIPKWKSRLYRLSPFSTLISMVAYFLYYSYRIHCTLDAQRQFNQVYVMAWIFISAEGCVACQCPFFSFYIYS